jgi:hypothetical protein
MINLHIDRIIQEIIGVDDYIYLPYIKNDQIFKNCKYSLIKSITEYLSDSSVYQGLEKHIDYFKKCKSEFIFPSMKSSKFNSFLKKILNLLSEQDFGNSTELHLLTKNNRLILNDSYSKFQNHNYRSVDIIDDIINLSLSNELNRGRYSLQILLDNIEFIDKFSLIEHIIIINEWLSSNISLAEYVDFDYDIIINKFIVGKINLIIDNRMIIINAQNTQKPSINEFIKYFLFFTKYNMDNKHNVNIIQYYNPIIGKLFEWDFTEWILVNNKYSKDFLDYFINL